DYKTDKGRKSSFMRDIFISYWINYKKRQKRKKLEGTLFGHPQLFFVWLRMNFQSQPNDLADCGVYSFHGIPINTISLQY
ncbi:MAG: hypothetical protein UC662_14445, partial [Paraprevotella clara]|nr:hypothetical protein [Paraprevotella clara]